MYDNRCESMLGNTDSKSIHGKKNQWNSTWLFEQKIEEKSPLIMCQKESKSNLDLMS